MKNKKIHEIGFDDQYMGDHNGEWDAWFLSDFLCLINGRISCTSDGFIEATSEDYKKRICFYADKNKFINFISWDDLDKYTYTQKDYLAFEGFCAKYDLQHEEWSDE